jgi:hypothetical protein
LLVPWTTVLNGSMFEATSGGSCAPNLDTSAATSTYHVPPSSGTWLTARRYEDDVLMLGSLPAPVSITFRISVGLDPTIAAPSITS